MQKKIIALAIAAAASSAAFAQTNVTLYGIADVGFTSTKTQGPDGHTVNGIDSGNLSTSRIGFKGSEDLGNGLKAIFALEYKVTMDNNAGFGGTSSARQQYVGLSDAKLGTVVAGYLQTAGYDFTVGALPLSGSVPFSTMHNVGLTSGQVNAAGRAQNAVAYISPNIAGLTLAYNYSANYAATETTTTNGNSSANLLGASYANGPITAGAVYNRVNLANTPNQELIEWGVRGGYDFKVVKVQAAYQTLKNESVSGERDNKWGIGATVPVSAKGNVIAEFAKSKIKSVADSDVKAYSLAYTHDLSKRTTGYAGYTYRNPEGAENNVQVIGLGVRHSF